MFLKAKLKSGEIVIGEFKKLTKVGRYTNAVFLGNKPFNVWKAAGDTLPSGEKNALRTREMYNGSEIVSICQVEPTTANHGLLPENFKQVPEVARGPRGIWTAPSGIEGITAGTRFPKHRDPSSYRDYVILTAASGETPESRYYVDGRGEGGSPTAPSFSSHDEGRYEDTDDDAFVGSDDDGDDDGTF